MFLLVPFVAAKEVVYTRVPWEAVHVKPAKPKAIGSADQRAWLAKLVQCESRGNASAVNPKDRDGTPSYGLLQFKPSTFRAFAKAYGIKATDYMDPDAQKAIVLRMMRDPSVDWHVQFPDCVRRLGLPPGVVG